jgi:hypothetical protein
MLFTGECLIPNKGVRQSAVTGACTCITPGDMRFDAICSLIRKRGPYPGALLRLKQSNAYKNNEKIQPKNGQIVEFFSAITRYPMTI